MLAKVGVAFFTISMNTACILSDKLGIFQNPNKSKNAESIASPTPIPDGAGTPWATLPPTGNRCEGLQGNLEIGILVGPSDAVGLEPVAVGNIPFSTINNGNLYLVQGAGPISYDNVLVEEWGTFSVKFDMENSITGECAGNIGSELLNFNLEMSGEQLVEVRSEGYNGDYPWSGMHNFKLNFPLEEGAARAIASY